MWHFEYYNFTQVHAIVTTPGAVILSQGFVERSKKLIQGLADRDNVFEVGLDSLKETLRFVKQELSVDSSTLAEIQLNLLHQRGLVRKIYIASYIFTVVQRCSVT